MHLFIYLAMPIAAATLIVALTCMVALGTARDPNLTLVDRSKRLVALTFANTALLITLASAF